MSDEIRQQIRFLVELQGVETKSLALNKKLGKMPAKIEEINAGLTSFELEVQTASEKIQALKKEYREFESEVQLNQAKIKKSDGKLGQVKNNKEYQAILKEIEEIQVKNSEIEDKMLEILEYIESEDQNVSLKKEELKRFSKEMETQKTGIEREGLEWEKQLSELDGERAKVTEKIAPQVLKTYEKVKKIVGPITIARVIESLCLGCNMNIPPQRYNELQRFDEIQLCPNCHRIIYWENSNDGSE